MADALGSSGNIAELVSVAVLVGTIALGRSKTIRNKRHEGESVHDVVVGVPSVVLNGQEITPARPGLIHRMTSAETHLATMQTTVEFIGEAVARIEKKATPNGGDTNNIGDVAMRNEKLSETNASKLDAIIAHLGLEVPNVQE